MLENTFLIYIRPHAYLNYLGWTFWLIPLARSLLIQKKRRQKSCLLPLSPPSKTVLAPGYIYIYIIHPELGIWDCLFRPGKGAGPL